MHFLIAIPTYNRPDLLLNAVDSVISQNYEDWTIIVSDNLSDIAAEEALGDRLKDKRIKLIRQKKHVTGTEHGRIICRHILEEKFDYFNMMADDDYMVPGALKYIASQKNLADYVVGGITYFYEKSRMLLSPIIRTDLTKQRLDFKKSLAWNSYNCGGVYIRGVDQGTELDTPESHVSFIFLSRNLLVKLCDTYGTYLVDPFGDVGLGLAMNFVTFYDYIPRPIGVIRFLNNYGQIQGRDRRSLITHHDSSLFLSPIKNVSFSNFSLESYLKVLSKLGINNIKISHKFLFRHLREVLNDNPKNKESLHAFREILLLMSQWKYLKHIGLFLLRHFFCRRNLRKKIIISDSCVDIVNAAQISLVFFGGFNVD